MPTGDSEIEKESIIRLYSRRAGHYNLAANLYYLIGFRLQYYRKKAVKALHIMPGDTVVEIGCGTGSNFPLLEKAVGPTGKIVGVDITEAMLVQARKRIRENEWLNVELVHSDAVSYHYPERLGGIISTFAITLSPDYCEIIRNGALSLAPEKRWVILDFRLPRNWLARFAPLLILFVKPFGGSMEQATRRPWECIDKYLVHTSLTSVYWDIIYIAVGEKPAHDPGSVI